MYVHCIQNKYVAQKQKQKMHPVDASRRKPKNKNCALEKYSIKKQSASNIFLYILMEFDDFVYDMAPGVRARHTSMHSFKEILYSCFLFVSCSICNYRSIACPIYSIYSSGSDGEK